MLAEFDLASVERGVLATRFEGRVRHFESVDSTNELALIAARAGAKWGVWVADEQTAGRGRGGHDWHSARGDGLYFSALVTPEIPMSFARDLPIAAGLAVQAAVLETTGLRLDLRWPNDLMFGARKCGGILVESASELAPAGWREDVGLALRYAVVGIGLNVGHRSFPAELARLATSLFLESEREYERESVLGAILRYLDDEVKRMSREWLGIRNGPSLYARFSAASSWVNGKRVSVDEGGGYTGWTRGLDPKGFLLVEDDQGVMRTVLSGGVRSLPATKDDDAARD
jgi:BirA family transcriptional regulator, biotin operon repressor / biotin---[acetyl-CoA-carboxylase] ligase